MRYFSPHELVSPAEANLQEITVMDGILPQLQKDLLEKRAVTISQPYVSQTAFEDLLGQFSDLLDSQRAFLPTRGDVDARAHHQAGYWTSLLKADTQRLVASPSYEFQLNPFAIRHWRSEGGWSADFYNFLDSGEAVLTGLTNSLRPVVDTLEVDHPKLYKTFFPDTIGGRYGSDVGNATLRLVIHESEDTLRNTGVDPEQIRNLPYVNPHHSRSSLGLLAWDSTDDAFGIQEGQDGFQLTQLKYLEGRPNPFAGHERKAHFFLGLGWSALYQGASRYEPLEYGVFRVASTDPTTRRTAAVVHMRPAFIDDGTHDANQRPYTPQQLADLRGQAMNIVHGV